jgi:hypothetical protein
MTRWMLISDLGGNSLGVLGCVAVCTGEGGEEVKWKEERMQACRKLGCPGRERSQDEGEGTVKELFYFYIFSGV